MPAVLHQFRPAQLWRDTLYVFGGIILAAFWLTVLWTLVSLGVGLAVLTVGIPILFFSLLLWRWGANRERERATLVLGAPIADAHRPLPPQGFWKRWGARFRDPATWKDLLFLGLVGPIVWVAFGAVVVALWAAALAALLTPVFTGSAPDGSWLGGLRPAEVVGIAVAGLVGIVAGARRHPRAWPPRSGALARGLLGPATAPRSRPVSPTLEATRAGAVDAADARLRRIERDLHDGAQQRLVAVAMDLGRAREKLDRRPRGRRRAWSPTPTTRPRRRMVELRDLVRGIHPAVLTDRGLDAAVSALAARCPVPVDVDVDAGPPAAARGRDRRLLRRRRGADQRRQARRRQPRGRRASRYDDGRLVVEVADDGSGGARRTAGSGLDGLAQRVEALDGDAGRRQPGGRADRVRAELPCAS